MSKRKQSNCLKSLYTPLQWKYMSRPANFSEVKSGNFEPQIRENQGINVAIQGQNQWQNRHWRKNMLIFLHSTPNNRTLFLMALFLHNPLSKIIDFFPLLGLIFFNKKKIWTKWFGQDILNHANRLPFLGTLF